MSEKAADENISNELPDKSEQTKTLSLEPIAIIGWTQCFNKAYFLVKYNFTESGLAAAKLIPADDFIDSYPDIFFQHLC